MQQDQKTNQSQQGKKDATQPVSSDMNADISKDEMIALERLETEPGDDDSKRAFLDHTDEDGTPLNEKAGYTRESGTDLDVPGAELDDADEEIGEEDEENNSYSQADTD